MIPQRVQLSGFLSYKDEQEVCFDGAQLWMLSGANGSGKSSVFDAVTYALFGHHRGGSQNVVELINKDSKVLAVEFDFTVEKHLYRIRRTSKRQKYDKVASTQQVLRYASHDAGGSWEPIAGTQLKAQFDAWVKDTIGLDHDTFTSSVLLLQGKAEKLLDSTPSGRAGVLARIVDLERFQKLHTKADEKRRELKGKFEELESQIQGLRDIGDDEYALAVARIEAADAARADTQARIEALQESELHARRWAEAEGRLAAARSKLSSAESLLGHAVAIEKDFARLRELRDVLPAVALILTERSKIGESEERTRQLTAEREAKAERREQVAHAHDQARKKLAALKKSLAEDEARLGKLNAELRALAGVLEKVRQVEDAETEVRRFEDEAKRLPADPDAEVKRLQAEQDRVTRLGQALPHLDRLHADRTELGHATAREAAAAKDESRLKGEGVAAKTAFDEVQMQLTAAREERATAERAAAEAGGLSHRARQLAEEFHKLSGAKTCTACGQELTPDHFKAEKTKRDREAKTAEKKLAELTAAADEAKAKEEELTRGEADARKRLDKLRDQYRERTSAAKQAGEAIAALVASCRQSYFALPDEFKAKLGAAPPDDWTAVAYPERHELTVLRAEAAGIDDVRRRLREAETAANAARSLREKLDSARERAAKTRQGLPAGDPRSLRQDHAAKQTEENAIGNQLAATKKELQRIEMDEDRQQRLLGEIDRDLVEIAGKFDLEEANRKHGHESVDRAKRSLPDPWQRAVEAAGMADRAKWQDEFDRLTENGTEAKHTQLQAARGGLDSLRAEIATLAEEANAFPESARRPVAEVAAEVAAAQDEIKARNADLLDAQRQQVVLDDYRRQRAELGERKKAVDAEFARYKTLAELLGRDRLQRHLVRRAERQIVDCANSVLDRLSAGQLFLKLVATEDAGTTEKALDLECSNRVTGGTAINVAFLSGSQRFRVAVALALGIGQYAGKQHRPIESVIIDEGFGCLDRNGRQVMIQELQNLRGHLHSILLVSHQEEFADAFPDGYRFELVNGATRVSRVQR